MKKLKKQYLKAKVAYEQGRPILSDASFDKLEAEIRAADPEWKGLRAVGARTSKTVTKLRQPMPSLDKVYPEDFQRWYNRSKMQQVTANHKLDGSSVLLTYEQGVPTQLVTRGNGELGQDISYLIPYLNLPELKHKGVLDIRCEAIMSRTNFKKTKGYSNPRNLVAGILGRDLDTSKESLAHLALIDVVALSVVGYTVDRGLAKLRRLGYPHIVASAFPVTAASSLTSEMLEQSLAQARETSDYDIDGLVLTYDVDVKYSKSNPKFAVAFKNNPADEDVPVVEVVDVIWQVSPSGRLTPKIEIEPLDTGDAVVKYATAHNAQWLQDRGIGPGAEVRVIRSGDVIPKIIDVVKSAKPKLPDVEYLQRGVYFYAVRETKEQLAKFVHRFLRLCKVENVAEGTVLPLIQSDERWAHPVTWFKLANAKRPFAERYLQKHGIAGSKRPGLIYLEAQALKSVDVVNLLDAVNVFETLIAETQLRNFQQHAPLLPVLNKKADVKEYVENALRDKQASGFGPRVIEELVAGLKHFNAKYLKLLELTEVTEQLPEVEAKVKGKYTGLVAAWTGYRSAEQAQYWTDNGGTVAKSISGKVTHVFYNPKGKFMDKVKAVADRAYIWDDFV